MKVKIGNYTGWFGPHQLAELLCFWVKPVKDEYGFKRKPDWVHDFGEWLAHGSVRPEREVGEVYKFMGEERPVTWLYKFLLWIENIKPDRKIKVKVDRWDTWNADHTLALVILPVIKQLKTDKHGAPTVNDEDVPDELKSTNAPAKENEWDTDDNHFKRWDWVLDQMIWSFEQIVDDSWEEQFHTGVSDIYFEQLENGMSEMKRGTNDTSFYDFEGAKAYNAKIDNGLRLFGKYYRSLWS